MGLEEGDSVAHEGGKEHDVVGCDGCGGGLWMAVHGC